MPALIEKVTDKSRMTEQKPFGPGVDQAMADKATVMEIWGSVFNEPGPDFCEFVIKAGDVEIARERVEGY